jgi:undecaprenyl-diphosphatase
LYHFGLQKGLKVIGLVILGVVLCDLLVSGLLKPLIGRVRPCHDASLTGLVHVVDKQCRGWFSFPSGHAANSFVIAEITFLITQKKIRWVLWLYLWAIIVAYSRIYVGVHYPLDILAGIGTGAFVGFGLVQIFKKSILKA